MFCEYSPGTGVVGCSLTSAHSAVSESNLAACKMLFNLQHTVDFRSQSTVMMCVKHVLPHPKFCYYSVNNNPRVCAEKAYLLK